MAADYGALEEQHRHIQSMAAPEDGIGVHVDHLDRWQRHVAAERLQLCEHLLAEVTVAAMDYGEDGKPFRASAPRTRAGPSPSTC